jgi:serine phosphatase RsbU (regulator of sigma subunit)/integral membrane sensor domain MASE1
MEVTAIGHPRDDTGQVEPSPATWAWPRKHPWAVFVLTATLYAVGSFLALTLIAESGLSSVFFIPAGMTVAFLLRIERDYWWLVVAGIVIAEATMDSLSGYSPLEIAFFVSGNAIEPLVGAAIVVAAVRSVDLARLRHLWWFFLGAVVIGPAVGAAIGSLGPQLQGTADFVEMFPQWWLGDAVGVVVIGSVILVWGSGPDRRSLWSPHGAALLVGTSLITVGVLGQTELRILFLVLVGVVIAGVVFGSRAVAVASLLVSIMVAVHLVWLGVDFSGDLDPGSALVILKLQLGVFTLAGLVVAAESAERDLALIGETEARIHAVNAEIQRTTEREVAIRLQTALLPGVELNHPYVDVAARYEAGTEGLVAGGDWYDVFLLPSGRIGITVGDVVGHGLEATAAMGRLRTAVAALAPHATNPGELLSFLHTVVNGPDGISYATATYAELDPDSGGLAFASAGHPPILLLSPEGSSHWLTDGLSPALFGPPRGLRPHARIRLARGSTLILYSDGLVEGRRQAIQVGLDRLQSYARALHGQRPIEICDALVSAMGVADTRRDDVVVLAIHYRDPSAAETRNGRS